MSGNGPLRSKQGCWTCRLRRKKCDERHPSCVTCDSLAITCYGYGSKPDWMDGGEREKAMATSIKQIVKHTSRRKGRFGLSLGRGKNVGAGAHEATGRKLSGDVKILSKNPGVEVNGDGNGNGNGRRETSSSVEPAVRVLDSTSPEQSHGSGTATSNTSHSPQAESTHSSSSAPVLAPKAAPSIPPSDAILLMHFLDHVFPLQYPMYHPSIVSGGRGWFLSLLLRTKPLYHAALALSSYHHGTVVYAHAKERACGGSSLRVGNRAHSGGVGAGNGSTGEEGKTWMGCPAQEKHIQICLKEFQEQIEESKRWVDEQTCPKDSLGFLGCVVQLTYFELFAGRGDTWQIHLRAATTMLRQGYTTQAVTLNLTDTLESISLNELAITHGEGVVTEDVATFRFLSAILFWLDILSCVTTGKTPRLLAFHGSLIDPDSGTQLEEIIGCKNWVVREIGRIATLHEWKMTGLLHGQLTAMDLEEKAEQIRGVINTGLAGDCMENLGVPDIHIPAIYHPMLITRVFALAASVYLHLVVYGFETESDTLNATMTEAMLILRTHMPNELLNAIVFPLYIFGCNAKAEDEDWFRGILGSAPVAERSMEHRGKLLPLMEKIWRSRRESCSGWSWQNNLMLSEYNLLLV